MLSLKRAAAMVVLGLVVAGAVSPVAAQTPPSTRTITFAKDVAPIFQAKCQVCHRPNSMAPMSLLTYEEVRPWIRSIRARVVAREMPPWFIDRTVGIQQFENDRSLTDQELDTVVRWIDAGAPVGNASDMPRPISWPNEDAFQLADQLGPPDLIVKAPSFTVPAQAPDQWFRPVVDIGLKEDRWLKAIEMKPSNRQITHHAGTFLYQDEDAAVIEAERALLEGKGTVDTLLAAMRQPSGRLVPASDNAPQFTEWAIGKPGEVFGENTGKLLRAGSRMGFEVHYHAVGEEGTDNTEVALWFYPKGVVPKYPVRFMAMASPRPLEIPPNKVSVHYGYYVLPAPAILHNFQPHMHLRGKAFLTEVILPDGQVQVLNYVPNFSFNWHVSYVYTDDSAPVLPKGTMIKNTIWYDNTSANKANPDPRQWVTGGARSVDEMGHGNTNIIFITEEDYQRIVRERQSKQSRAANLVR
jgi:hypothetical protein